MKCCDDTMVKLNPGRYICVWCDKDVRTNEVVPLQEGGITTLKSQGFDLETTAWGALFVTIVATAFVAMSQLGVFQNELPVEAVYVFKEAAVIEINLPANYTIGY